MVKARKNRQPREWHKITHQRSFSGVVNGNAKIQITKLSDEGQLSKVIKNASRLNHQIDRLTKEKNTSTTSEERRAYIEAALVKLKHKFTNTTCARMVLEGRIAKYLQQRTDKQENEQKEIAIRKANNEKALRRMRELPIDNGKGDRRPGTGGIVDRVERIGTRKRVRHVWRDKV